MFHLFRRRMGDNVSTIHNENEEVLMAVKMPHGMSDRVKIHNTVLQGTKLGPLECIVNLKVWPDDAMTKI